MTKEEINTLWSLYRDFCRATNAPNMVESAPEFLTWLEKYKFPNY